MVQHSVPILDFRNFRTQFQRDRPYSSVAILAHGLIFLIMYENLFDASSDEHDVPSGVDHPDELEAVPDEGPANAVNGRGGQRGAYNQRRIGRIKAGMAKRQLVDARNSVIQLSGMLKPALSEKVSSVFGAKMLDEAVERKISVGVKCATVNLRRGKSGTRCATTKSLVDRG